MEHNSSAPTPRAEWLPTVEEFADIFTMDTSCETTVTTFMGKEVNLQVPDPASIFILDIAHHESQINRYNGGCPFAYSVAQHSVLGSYLFGDHDDLALAFLLHDGSEAYVGDDVKQKKNIVKGVKELENTLQRAICERFGLPWPMPPEVKQADLAIYALELVKILNWRHKVKVLPEPVRHMTIEPIDWKDARHHFLARFYQLYYRTRTVRFKDGEVFFSGKAESAFSALAQAFDIKVCCEAMESGVIPIQSSSQLLLRKAA